jgi:hypothetical protein
MITVSVRVDAVRDFAGRYRLGKLDGLEDDLLFDVGLLRGASWICFASPSVPPSRQLKNADGITAREHRPDRLGFDGRRRAVTLGTLKCAADNRIEEESGKAEGDILFNSLGHDALLAWVRAGGELVPSHWLANVITWIHEEVNSCQHESEAKTPAYDGRTGWGAHPARNGQAAG